MEHLSTELMDALGELPNLIQAVDAFWLFVGAILVFFMQTGFTMVETGFTRAKNAGNIVMKNIVDFLLGSIFFWLVGYALMFGSGNGFIGLPGTDPDGISTFMNGSFASDSMNYTKLFFQTVFCATSATIVSGAVAERTNFKAYVIYSGLISLFIYPIAGHWVWGGGWLQNLGFHDFAGSAIVHMLGGTLACVGAIILGPRLGKYSKSGKVNVIPGHNIVIGALGVLILWVGWFGFNPASTGALSGDGWKIAAKVFITTNLAACAAALVTMFYTWFRFGKPDVSMTLNGILGGLVAVTAPCDVISPLSAVIIGAVGGILMSLAISFIDQKLKIDDPVGAISVHGVCGLWGTIAVGLFANDGLDMTGLFFGGGFKLLGIQALGVVAIVVWATIFGCLVFGALNKAGIFRASAEEEIKGMDIAEHGLPSAYPDFQSSYRE